MRGNTALLAAWCIVVATLSGCQPSSTDNLSLPAPVAERMPAGVHPTGYKVDLTINPTQERFNGVVEIALVFDKPTKEMWLHGQDLAVSEAQLTTADGRKLTAAYAPAEDHEGWARVSFAETMQSGAATLRIAYDAPYGQQGAALYRFKSGEAYYVASQMEPLDARRVIPSFDEPRFKVPFKVSVTAPASDKAFFNTREVGAETLATGMVRHEFAPTTPLPTYLIAFGVGPWDVREVDPMPPTALRDHAVPLRGIVVAGKADQLGYALEHTRAMIEYFEDYFGVAYPFDKLDIIGSVGFPGAMENPGLIYYDETLILMAPGAGVSQRRAYASVHAHELAHLWFGDYVTPSWWDDIWLNEAFATWMGNKGAQAALPELGVGRDTQADALDAIAVDSFAASRQIRQPIATNADINDAFDAITYSKGGGVLGMIEAYVGEDRFREGVRLHMKRFANGVATSDDFFTSLAEGAKAPEIADALRSFTDQPNAPLVTATKECRDNKPVIKLSQSTYRPLGSTLPDRLWNIPVCVAATAGNGASSRACTLIREPTAELALPDAACASAIVPNADGAGYYRFSMPGAEWDALLAAFQRLPASEQLATIDSLRGSYLAGEAGVESVLAGMSAAARVDDLDVLMAGAGLARTLRPMIPQTERGPFGSLVVSVFGPRLATLTQVRAPRPEQSRALSNLTRLLSGPEMDRNVRVKLVSSARAELGLGRGAPLSPDLRTEAFCAAIEDGGQPVFEALLAKADTSSDELYRQRAFAGLGCGADTPALRQALWDAARKLRLSPPDWLYILFSNTSDPDHADEAWAAAEPHLTEVVRAFPPFLKGTIAQAAGGLCTTEAAKSVSAYFAANAAEFPGHERTLAQTVEGINQCVALRTRDAGALTKAVAVAAQRH